MKIALTFGPMCMAFRKTLDFSPRPGLSVLPRPPVAANGVTSVTNHPLAGQIPRYEIGGTNIIVGGGVHSAEDWATIGATDCLSLTDPPDVGVPESHLCHATRDDDGSPFAPGYRDRVCGFAHDVLAGGGRLYLHCWVGASRSPSIAYAVLRDTYGMSQDEALAAIRGAYPFAPPYGTDPKHQAYIGEIDQWVSRRGESPGLYDDPRGLTGSEYGVIRVAEELAAIGHSVTMFTHTSDTEWHGVKLRPLEARGESEFDVAISWSEPDTLREVKAKVRVLYAMLNTWSFVQPGFQDHFDLGVSVSPAHLDKILHDWRGVGSDANGQPLAQYVADPAKWTIVPLGCDPDRLANGTGYDFTGADVEADDAGNVTKVHGHPLWAKTPGKVVYASSPDRGLHWLLQEWPAIKRAVPHATLHIYYRLADWLPTFDTTPYFPPIEPNRAIVTYVRECLRRFQEHGGMGVTIHDSVSRNEIHRELASAECLAYPCSTMSWSEGFSCTILEACAARACPITTDCDALGSVYGEALPLTKREGDWVTDWRNAVIRALTDAEFRDVVNEKARAFAEKLTWRKTAEGLLAAIEGKT